MLVAMRQFGEYFHFLGTNVIQLKLIKLFTWQLDNNFISWQKTQHEELNDHHRQC